MYLNNSRGMSTAGLAPRQIYLAHLSFINVCPPDFVQLAAAAGFDGLTLRLAAVHPTSGEAPYPMLSSKSTMMSETLAVLADLPVRVLDVEAVRITPETDVKSYLPLLEGASKLGAKSLIAFSIDSNIQAVAEGLYALAELARPYAIEVALEFMIYNGIRTLAEAHAVLDIAAHPNLRIMIDALHLSRSGSEPGEIFERGVDRMSYFQICDAPYKPLDERFDGVRIEARSGRLMPGDGLLPLVELINQFPSSTTVSVETPMQILKSRSNVEIARMVLARTRDVLQRADELRASTWAFQLGNHINP